MSEMQEDDDEPEEGDYLMYPAPPLGTRWGVGVIGGRHIGFFNTDEESYAAIKAGMDAEDFHPNVWVENDHGNQKLVKDLGLTYDKVQEEIN